MDSDDDEGSGGSSPILFKLMDSDDDDEEGALACFWLLMADDDPKRETKIEKFFAHKDVVARLSAFEKRENELLLKDMETIMSSDEPPYGYVYAAWTSCFCGLVKIGCTMRTPVQRLRDFPFGGFTLIAAVGCANPIGMLRDVHEHFSDKRKYGAKEEYIQASREAVAEFFDTLVPQRALKRARE